MNRERCLYITNFLIHLPGGYMNVISYTGSCRLQKFWLWENGTYYVYHHPNATPCFTVFDTTGVYI